MNYFSLIQKEAIIAISNGEIQVTTKDVYYWITHYIFDDIDGITPKVIKARITQLVNENGIVQIKEKKEKKQKKVKIPVESSESEEEPKQKKRIVRRQGHFY